MTRRAVLWRHGRTAWNRAQRFQGHSDVPLDEVGLQQAAGAAAVIADFAPQAIVSSDLMRATQTAAALAAVTGQAVRADVDLREAHAGRWQGLTHAQITADDGAALAAWRDDPEVRPGGTGETRAEVAARVTRCLEATMAAAPEDSTVVFVTHGGAARAAVGHLLGMPPAGWQNLAVLGNCGWAVLHLDHGSWRLERYNQTVMTPGAAATSGVPRESIV
ncbi:MAG: histidine phosphatase family protein [Candidatus Nanopelagicales bacterium]